VAEVDGRIVGHILFNALSIGAQRQAIEALSLAPMAGISSISERGSARRYSGRD
jgi:predicted N-acetyltransferase YhbS